MSYLEAVKRERRRLSILGTLFVVGTVAWVIDEGWTSTGGLLSFSLFVFGTVAFSAQRFAHRRS
jgi:hypothetical protein